MRKERYNRESMAEQMRKRRLDALVSEYTNPERIVCPMCGTNIVGPRKAERFHGVCEQCLLKARQSAVAQQQAELEEKRRYDAARQKLLRTRNEMGLPHPRKRIEIRFD